MNMRIDGAGECLEDSVQQACITKANIIDRCRPWLHGTGLSRYACIHVGIQGECVTTRTIRPGSRQSGAKANQQGNSRSLTGLGWPSRRLCFGMWPQRTCRIWVAVLRPGTEP